MSAVVLGSGKTGSGKTAVQSGRWNMVSWVLSGQSSCTVHAWEAFFLLSQEMHGSFLEKVSSQLASGNR